MPTKVKRGLGLLVVAVTAWLVAMALLQVRTTGDVATGLVLVALLAASLVALGGLVGGLGLLAWGLLRD